jgi:hypothetical protein
MDRPPPRRLLVVALALFALAFGCRAAYLFATGKYKEKSSSEMERAATSLAREGVLGNVFADDSGPSAHVVPLYSCLLAGIHWLLGIKSLAAMVAQQLLAVSATALVIAALPWLAWRCRLPVAAGILTALFLAVSPLNLWVETSGSWEQPYAVGVMLLLLLALARLHDSNWQDRRAVVFTGLLLGVSALLSPAILPFAALAIFFEFLTRARVKLDIVGACCVMAILVTLILAPWVYRNYRVLGGFVPLRSNFGLELLIGNNPESNGQTFNTDWTDSNNFLARTHPVSDLRERAHLKEIGELAYMREKGQLAQEWIAANPGAFARLTLERARLYWLPPESLWDAGSPGRRLKPFVFGLLSLGGFLGLAGLFRSQHPYRWLFLALLLGPSLIYVVTHVNPRYRYFTFWVSALLTCTWFVQAIHWAVQRVRGTESAGRALGTKKGAQQAA